MRYDIVMRLVDPIGFFSEIFGVLNVDQMDFLWDFGGCLVDPRGF